MNLRCALLLAASLAIGGPAAAAGITLTDGNTSATWDLESQAGLSEWVVAGVDHAEQEWFWLNLGGADFSLDTIGLTGTLVTDTDLDGDEDTLDARYFDAATGLSVQLHVSLSDGGPNLAGEIATLVEQVTITNNSAGSIYDALDVFTYSDFDLLGSGDDVATADAGSFLPIGIFQGSGAGVLDGPAFLEINWAPLVLLGYVALDGIDIENDGSILADLNDGSRSDFGFTSGTVTGDVESVIEFDFGGLAPGESVQFTIIKTLLVPEPGAALLAGCGLLGLTLLGRRRR